MNIPNKLYIEVRGEILECYFIETKYEEKEDVLYIHYSDNIVMRIFNYTETKDNFKEHFLKSLHFHDLWISKEDLIKVKTQNYSKTINHHKILFEKATEYLNKLTNANTK